MTDRLKDKAIIVIGSGSGIGAATVRRLAAEGARVCAATCFARARYCRTCSSVAVGRSCIRPPVPPIPQSRSGLHTPVPRAA